MELFNCRLCGGRLETVLNLGNLCISGFIADDSVAYEKAPLVLSVCEVCKTAQLKHIVEPDKMYRQYWYKSSLNASMMADLQDVVDSALERYAGESKIVLDIGANDGSMLAMYPDFFTTVGFDPAHNLKGEAELRCNYFINDYFSADLYPSIGKAGIVTAIAMFYDLNNPHAFLNDVIDVMADDGIFVIQMTDLISMLKANACDNLCHEHACYYTLDGITRLLNSHHMYVFDVEYNMVNGGSVRVYAAKDGSGYVISERLSRELARESEYMGRATVLKNQFVNFSVRVTSIGLALTKYILDMATSGAKIYGLGASTKGNTLLQYYNIGRNVVTAIGEVNEDKFGLFTIGTMIPIIPEKDVLNKRPDILLILPWHFEDFFIGKLWNVMQGGTVLLFPLPEPKLVYVSSGMLYTRKLIDMRMEIPWAI